MKVKDICTPKIEIAARDHSYSRSRPIYSGVIKRIEVVDRRIIGRCQGVQSRLARLCGESDFRRRPRLISRLDSFGYPDQLRLLVKIVQRMHARHNRSECHGYLRIARIRPMLLTFHHIFMNSSVKRLLHLARCSRKFHDRSALSHSGHLEPVRLQPRGDDLNILVSGPELQAKIFRSEPLVIVR